MLDTDIENNLALAGVCQAAALVQQLARRGSADNEAIEASLSSILVTDPETPQQVFGQLANLKPVTPHSQHSYLTNKQQKIRN